MYKNFILTDKEKKEIIEQHRNQGYGKSINEQKDLSYLNDSSRLILDPHIYIPTNNVILFVLIPTSDTEIEVKLTFTDEGDVENYEIGNEFNQEINEDEIINFVMSKINSGEITLPDSVYYNYKTDELKQY